MINRGKRVIVGLLCVMSGCGVQTPLDRVLARGAGPVDADAPEEFTTADSGLRYRILRKGTGESPTPRDTVIIRFAGWLDNGRQFDTTYGQIEPVRVPLDGSIAALREGLTYVSEGGMIELDVPSKLGYGTNGHSDLIPPNTDLNFLVELVQVEKAPAVIEPGPTDSDAPSEFSTTDSGLRYRILRKGDGPKPAASDTVSVHYRGTLMDGKIFDSSYLRGVPFDLKLGNTIEGWKEGMTLIGVGGMIELEIPSELGYGEQGIPKRIPPNADLKFLVELLEIKSAE